MSIHNKPSIQCYIRCITHLVLFISLWTLVSILKPLSVFYTYISIFVTLQYDVHVLCVLCLYDPYNKFLQRPINLSYVLFQHYCIGIIKNNKSCIKLNILSLLVQMHSTTTYLTYRPLEIIHQSEFCIVMVTTKMKWLKFVLLL